MTGEKVRVELELDVEGETVRGRISSPQLPSTPFYGWLELAAKLEKARKRANMTAAAERGQAETTTGEHHPVVPSPRDP